MYWVNCSWRRLVCVDMLEQRFAVVGHQNQRLLAEIGAGGRIKPLAQADQVTFLDVEQGFTVDKGVQQTAFEQIELSFR